MEAVPGMGLKVIIIRQPKLGALENAINEKYDKMGPALKELHFLDNETCAIVYDNDELIRASHDWQ